MYAVICKLQRPLATNDERRPWLLYNEARNIEIEIPDAEITDFVRRKMRNDLKAYWECRINDGELDFIKRAPAQDW